MHIIVSDTQPQVSNAAKPGFSLPLNSLASYAMKGVLLGIGAYGNILFVLDKIVTKVQVEVRHVSWMVCEAHE